MAYCQGLRTIWLLLFTLGMEVQASSAPGVEMECLGNILRLSLDKNFLMDRNLRVDAVYGAHSVPITNDLASQCGYRMTSDPWGNVKLYVSVQNCFTEVLNDGNFNVTLQLVLSSDAVVYTVTKVCTYTKWAFREILCDKNYMEVSVRRRLLDIAEEAPFRQKNSEGSWFVSEKATTSEYTLWKVLFHMPGGDKTLNVQEAQNQGYGLTSTPTRLVIRGPRNSTEAYTESVAGVSMQVLKMSTFFRQKWMVTLVDAAIACPSGGLTFTSDVITWTLPRIILPLMSSERFQLLEVHMGIDGQRMDGETMAARGYMLSVTDQYIMVQIPVGAPDGYYKSCAPGYQYHIIFTIDAMLELLWQEEDIYADTRYKVLYPITTPIMPRPPYVINNTVVQEKVFKVLLGMFYSDVELVNITFGSQLLSIEEAIGRGFKVQEHLLSNGSKTFSLEVPFSDSVVLKHTTEAYTSVFMLMLVFGLIIVPEHIPFGHTAVLEAALQDIVLPTAKGTCDQENFYITVKLGNLNPPLLTVVGKRVLSPEMAKVYRYQENETDFSIAVSFKAADAVYEMVHASTVRSRLDMVFRDPVTNKDYNHFSIACSFPMIMTECLPNGTVTVLALKLASTPHLTLSDLTLRDADCRAILVTDYFAYFSFHVNTCGTTRKFKGNIMVYENDISVPWHNPEIMHFVPRTPEQNYSSDMHYRLKVSCYYMLNVSHTMTFNTRAQLTVPLPVTGMGESSVRMRLSSDASYDLFYQDIDYPVVKYLKQPLYFEVELMQSTDPMLELILENCWATTNENVTSLLKWDIIVNSCENLEDHYPAIFHPVMADARVQFPSHFKRFEIKMFSFTIDGKIVGQITVHCDIVLCNALNIQDNVCNMPCKDRQHMNVMGAKVVKRERRNVDHGWPLKDHVSSHPIFLA